MEILNIVIYGGKPWRKILNQYIETDTLICLHTNRRGRWGVNFVILLFLDTKPFIIFILNN